MTIDIIATARQAGFVLEGDISGAGRLPLLLERFAALVRAQVLEDIQRAEDAIRGMKSEPGHSVSSAAEASTWQPIDTAPKDGT